MEVNNLVQEGVTKTIPKKKKCKKAKWLFEETLKIAEKRREEKQKVKDKINPAKYRVPENSKDLIKEEAIKRWKEYTEEQYKKDLNDSYNHDGVVTHPEPDILECEVKRTLGSITTKLVEVMKFQLSCLKF